MSQYYLRIEVVNLDYSIYDTHDISTIRGGSFLILDAFKGLKKEAETKKLPIDVISSAASEAIIKITADEKDVSDIVAMCLETIPAEVKAFATLVNALIPISEHDGFQTHIEKLKAACRWQQYKKRSFVFPKPEATAQKACELDGVRPGIHPEVKKVLSTSVNIRRQRGKKLRNNLYRELLNRPDLFLKEEDEITTSQPSKFADDLETLSSLQKMGNLNGKIAFIHLDGNRFGKIRSALCTNAEKLKAFQEHVQEGLRKSALTSILEYAIKTDSFMTKQQDIRLETLLWGGDEIEWVVPAWQAFNVLKLFFKAASQYQDYPKTSDHPLSLTHSAGVVFCHYKLPMLQVRKYAEKLCELAKKTFWEEIKKRDNTASEDITNIDSSANRMLFLNMAAFDLIKGDVEDFLQTYYAPASIKDFIIQANEFESLEQPLKIIKTDFPRNKLFDITNALKASQHSQIDTILQRVYQTIRPEDRKEALKQAIQHVVGENLYRWFVITDLINYVGENT